MRQTCKYKHVGTMYGLLSRQVEVKVPFVILAIADLFTAVKSPVGSVCQTKKVSVSLSEISIVLTSKAVSFQNISVIVIL